ncbi:MAG: hypothetical protein P8N94_15610 [Gammaproteobacteria bacterium]|nr:hypothetical protein [Gammaproteobacteria bacterium]
MKKINNLLDGISPVNLKEEVIEPTLDFLGMNSKAAVKLLMGTAAHESLFGHFLKQVQGPARGIYQMEPATHVDLWTNYIDRRPPILVKVEKFLAPHPSPVQQLSTNLSYSTAMARVHFWRRPEPLPHHDDIPGLAAYYKRFWNTYEGKASEADFIAALREIPSFIF